MKDHEVLLLAIKKAEANGFVMDKHKHFLEIGRNNFTGQILKMGAFQSIIFDQEFAKAIWKENWKFHLQEMVIAENPIQYLKEFVEVKK